MKKICLLLILCFVVSSNMNSQTQQDSLVMLQDSMRVLHVKMRTLRHASRKLQGSIENDTIHRTWKQKQADKILGSLFGKSNELSNADSIIRDFDDQPSFGMYKSNYFITGANIFRKINRDNSDAKFQVSIRQRLTNSTLPFKTHIFLTYTQKAFWDIYRESLPFRDLNYNPAIGIGRPLIHNNRLLGSVAIAFEHESNGKDGTASRSWNKINFQNILVFRDRWILQTQLWIPLIDGDGNRDIVGYSGYGTVALTYSSLKRKYNATCMITKRSGNIFDANVQLNFSVRMFSNEDIYLFVEYYDGYGECLLDYKEYRQRLRAGILMNANMISPF